MNLTPETVIDFLDSLNRVCPNYLVPFERDGDMDIATAKYFLDRWEVGESLDYNILWPRLFLDLLTPDPETRKPMILGGENPNYIKNREGKKEKWEEIKVSSTKYTVTVDDNGVCSLYHKILADQFLSDWILSGKYKGDLEWCIGELTEMLRQG